MSMPFLKRGSFYLTSLHQRTIIFILIPIFLFLTFAGIFGYRAVRELLLEQWTKTAMANLERAAHQIDMQLKQPKQILMLLENLPQDESTVAIHEFIVEQLRRIDGVVKVKVDWPEEMPQRHGMRFMRNATGKTNTMDAGGRKTKWMFDIAQPEYTIEHSSNTISMMTRMVDSKGRKVGSVEVILDFKGLVAQTVATAWWNVYKAYIVDPDGTILIGTSNAQAQHAAPGKELFGSVGSLEKQTLAAIQQGTSGTVFGPGMPPEEISGFYQLKEAPWSMVVIAPGQKVLQPIIHFRNVYFLVAIACIVVLLLFIRIMIEKTTRAIKEVSRTASDLARGIFSEPLTVRTRDEVGELTQNFNTMTQQLQKGVKLQEAMDIAQEVQLTLLPQEDITGKDVMVSGLSIYCDETGGDYFDFFPSESHPERQHVIVGDVVGHGIGAALLMATLRALVRANVDQSGDPAAFITGVNKQLCRDTSELGNFASLFYLRIDLAAAELQWVRAGHDPAILYYPDRDEFKELKGKGLVLGLNPDFAYQGNSFALTDERLLILMVSDGVWESVNGHGEQFGKERVNTIIRQNRHLSPKALLESISSAIDQFRGDTPLSDDITMVAVNIHGDTTPLWPKNNPVKAMKANV